MQLESIKMVGTAAWVSAVGTVGVAGNFTSASGWAVLIGLAVVPPLVMMWRWNTPTQTLSESIQEARR